MLEITNYKLYKDDKKRRLFVLKGATFDSASKKYLFIIHDAQNFFAQKYTTYISSWKIEKALKQLGVTSYLVAGLECKKNFARLDEYSPVAIKSSIYEAFSQKEGPIYGQKYLKQLKSKLIPDLEKRYQFSFKKTKSCMIGASMGGVITTFEALANPTLYTAYISFSTALFVNEPAIHNFIASKIEIGNYFHAMGGNEVSKTYGQNIKNQKVIATSADYVKAFQFLEKQMARFNNPHLKSHFDASGVHNERSWSQQLPIALKWFFSLS